MPISLPSGRTPLRPLRANRADLDAVLNDLPEGELCYALDENRLFMVELDGLGDKFFQEVYAPATPTGSAQDSLNAVSNPLTPIGTIVWLQLPTSAAPIGFLYCSGIDKSRNQYPSLFSTIGTTYGPGDGVTSFGIPLESNLIAPAYAVDSSWNPFIKTGAKIGEAGTIMSAGGIGVTPQRTYNLTGTLTMLRRAAADVEPYQEDADGTNTSLSADGEYLAFTNPTGGLWTAKRNGNGWTKMTVTSPPTLTGATTSAVAISRDGTKLVASSNACPLYMWTRSGLTWGSRQTVTNPAASTADHWLQWSNDGTYLIAQSLWTDTKPRVFKMSAGSLVELATLSNAPGTIGPASWHPSGLFLMASTDAVEHTMWARSGDTFSIIPGKPLGFVGRSRYAPAWSADGSLFATCGSTGYSSTSGVRAWTFNNGNFTALPTADTTTNEYGLIPYPDSNTEFFMALSRLRYSIADGTMRLVGTYTSDGDTQPACRWAAFAITP
jgi:hypothetical protein